MHSSQQILGENMPRIRSRGRLVPDATPMAAVASIVWNAEQLLYSAVGRACSATGNFNIVASLHDCHIVLGLMALLPRTHVVNEMERSLYLRGSFSSVMCRPL